jgi:hypothetical protein
VTLLTIFWHESHRKHSFHCYSRTINQLLHWSRCLFNLLLHSNGCCSQSHRLATGLYATLLPP